MKRLAVLLFVGASAQAQLPPLAEVTRSDIEYKSVPEALSAIRKKPGVDISVREGWTIAYETANHTLWSFAPTGHKAYPAVVKRAILEKEGQVFINMSVLCGASKEACDSLVREFTQLNEQMRADFDAKRGQAKSLSQ